jgi:putative flippase GtrA
MPGVLILWTLMHSCVWFKAGIISIHCTTEGQAEDSSWKLEYGTGQIGRADRLKQFEVGNEIIGCILYTEQKAKINMITKQQNAKKTKGAQKKKPELRRMLEYFVSGGAWFWSGYLIIIALDDVIPLFYANFIGNAVGLTINFILQRYWVFEGSKKEPTKSVTTRYVVYTAINAFGLNYLILQGLRNVGIEPEIGQFIASGFFTIWNYYWYKVYVFKEKRS